MHRRDVADGSIHQGLYIAKTPGYSDTKKRISTRARRKEKRD